MIGASRTRWRRRRLHRPGVFFGYTLNHAAVALTVPLAKVLASDKRPQPDASAALRVGHLSRRHRARCIGRVMAASADKSIEAAIEFNTDPCKLIALQQFEIAQGWPLSADCAPTDNQRPFPT
jgi:hypothetical protein